MDERFIPAFQRGFRSSQDSPETLYPDEPAPFLPPPPRIADLPEPATVTALPASPPPASPEPDVKVSESNRWIPGLWALTVVLLGGGLLFQWNWLGYLQRGNFPPDFGNDSLAPEILHQIFASVLPAIYTTGLLLGAALLLRSALRRDRAIARAQRETRG